MFELPSKLIPVTLLFLCAGVDLQGQTYSDQGIIGGSGIVLMQTTAVSPKGQFRVSLGRTSLPVHAGTGVNVLGFSGGFSSHVEAYAGLLRDNTSTDAGTSSYVFGGKFLMPFPTPLVDRLALWFESASSEDSADEQLLPTGIMRSALIGSVSTGDLTTSFLIGASIADHIARPVLGIGGTLPVSHSVQVGFEVIGGYAGRKSVVANITSSMRIAPYVNVQISPGYLEAGNHSTWLLSIGLSAASADIDFMPVPEEKKSDFRMPTIEEIEQQTREEKK